MNKFEVLIFSLAFVQYYLRPNYSFGTSDVPNTFKKKEEDKEMLQIEQFKIKLKSLGKRWK